MRSFKNRKKSCEVDLRKEFDQIVFGINGCKPHNTLILIRNMRLLNDNRIKCECFNALTNEANSETECKYCLGEGYIWDERFTRCYSNLIGADGGKANRTRSIMPGEILTDYKVFYLRYDEKISYYDKIIELALDIEGNLQVPYKRKRIYKPETIQENRADNGRIEFITVYAREESSIRKKY